MGRIRAILKLFGAGASHLAGLCLLCLVRFKGVTDHQIGQSLWHGTGRGRLKKAAKEGPIWLKLEQLGEPLSAPCNRLFMKF